MSLPVKAVRFESDGRVARGGGDPGAERECKKVRILYSRANYGLPRGPPWAAAGMRIVIWFFTFHMFLKSCVFCKKVRIVYTTLGCGRPRAPPLAGVGMLSRLADLGSLCILHVCYFFFSFFVVICDTRPSVPRNSLQLARRAASEALPAGTFYAC